MRISSVPSGWPRVDTYTIATSSSGSIAAPISSSESRRFVSVAIGAATSVRGLLTRTTERAAVPQRSSITRCAASTSSRNASSVASPATPTKYRSATPARPSSSDDSASSRSVACTASTGSDAALG